MADTTFPPGEFIQDELEARGWSIRELARRIGGTPAEKDVTQVALEMLVHGPVEGVLIGEDMSAQLGRVFGNNPEFFVNLDKLWQPETYRAAAQPVGADDA